MKGALPCDRIRTVLLALMAVAVAMVMKAVLPLKCLVTREGEDFSIVWLAHAPPAHIQESLVPESLKLTFALSLAWPFLRGAERCGLAIAGLERSRISCVEEEVCAVRQSRDQGGGGTGLHLGRECLDREKKV